MRRGKKVSATRSVAALLVATLVLAACGDDVAGPDGAGQVAVRFTTSGGAAAGASYSLHAGGAPLVIVGSNGTLTITEMRMIVAELELEREDDSDDCDTSGSGNGCEEFEAPASFVTLPLGSGAVTVATGTVPPGTYHELEFEVEDIDFDDDDEDQQQIQAVAAAVRAAFPEWPENASLVVIGTFTPTGGSPQPFRVFIEAEIEVELDLVPPLVIDAAGASREITVELLPASWFKRADGQVVDLSQFDFAATGKVPEFELEIESRFDTGFRAEVDDDDD